MSWQAAALVNVDAHAQDWIDEIIAIAGIPAPSHHEQERARYVLDRLRALDYRDAQIDETGNVMAEYDGGAPGPHIMLVAHLDTVFDMEVHTAPRRDGAYLRGPSVGDNSSGVGALIAIAKLLREHEPTFPGRLTLAWSVGEEGLGNLKGVRALMDRADRPDLVLAVDGLVGRVVTKAIASLRMEVKVTTEGGHSWGNFGNESAIAIAAACVAELTSLPLSTDPKTTLNVGTFHGGISVNSIASEASFSVELRSEEQATLDELRRRVEDVLQSHARRIRGDLSYQVLGERPGGVLPDDHFLYDIIRDVHKKMGIETSFAAASTDANIPLSLGIGAVAFGVCRSFNAHRTDEYLEIDSVPVGIKQLVHVLDALWKYYSNASDSSDRVE